MITILKTDFAFSDDRGDICQLLSFPNKQVNYLFTRKNAKRGCHYHKNNREYFYMISGKVELTGYDVGTHDHNESYTFEKGSFFCVEPYTVHDFRFLEDTQMIVVYDKGVEEENGKDIYTE